jgi:hypothetical protein
LSSTSAGLYFVESISMGYWAIFMVHKAAKIKKMRISRRGKRAKKAGSGIIRWR